MTRDCDVAIVGGGPAGLSAATELKRLGVQRVVVLERFEEAGGISRHCGHPPFGLREFRRVMTGPAYARRLVSVAREAGVDIRTRTTVTRIGADGCLEIARPDGAGTLTAQRVLLATGNREQTRAQHLTPGLRPLGVMNTAALQSLIYLENRRPFRKPVIIGSEMVSLSALLTCRRHGIHPVAMVEPASAPRVRRTWLGLCRLLKVPVLTGAEIVAIEGSTRVEGLCLRLPDGRAQRLDCDGVVFSGRFTPEATLARQSALRLDPGTLGPHVDADGRSSDPAVFVAGNVLHPVETAGYCWTEGRRVASAIARDLGQGAVHEAQVEVRAGAGVRYVVPQLVSAGQTPGTLNIRVHGPARGRLVLRSADGRTLVQKMVNCHAEHPLRLTLPRLTRADLNGALEVALDGGA